MVLLLLDEEKVVRFVTLGLKAERFAVDDARDGSTGLEMALKTPYDLLIVDLMLPELSGTELECHSRRGTGDRSDQYPVTRNGITIRLTAKEYSLLEYLAVNSGRVVSQTMIVEHVWDQSFEGLTNIMDVYIRQLRAKIDEPFNQHLIHTVRRGGYTLSEEDEN